MERRLLQFAIACAGLIGVILGLTGVLFSTMHADLSSYVPSVAQRSALI